MLIKMVDKNINDYGNVYEVEVVARFVEGIKARRVDTGEIAFVARGSYREVKDEEAR